MRKKPHPPAAIKVAVIAFDGITPFHLSVPCLVFGSGLRNPESPVFEVTVCAPGKAPLRTSAGFSIVTECEFGAAESADIVVMPSWYDDCRDAPASLLAALRGAHKRGARVVGLCLGAFPLAEAGLLDGRSATTHWAHTAELAERFPKVRVDPEVLYIDEGEVLTSAGVAAGLDCCLHVLRQFAGADAANKVARRLLIAPHRQGGQAQFIERPVPASSAEGRFSQALEWVTRHLEQEHSIDALAERTAMSRRNFTRHFRQATGTSFKQWLLNQRLAYAQRMLETSDASVEAVAQKTGFGTGLSLRQHFRATLRTSPTEYRKQFRTDAAAAQKTG